MPAAHCRLNPEKGLNVNHTLPTYVPRAGTLASLLCEFFRDNPDEELSRSDIASKFDVNATSIDNSIKAAIDAGVIATKNSEDMTRVWVAGPSLPQPTNFKRWLAKQGKKSAEGRAAPPPMPDVLSLLQAIAADVPLPEPAPKGAAYHAVWKAMEVKHSVPVDEHAAKRLAANAQAWGKANGGRKFLLRQLPDGTSRIWRTE